MRTINSGWLFAKGVQPDSAAFTPVCIPHTWNTDAYTDKNIIGGRPGIKNTHTFRAMEGQTDFSTIRSSQPSCRYIH